MQREMRWNRVVVIGTMFSLFLCRDIRADAIDAYVQKQMRQLALPGVALAVVRDGRAVTVRTYGMADLEQGLPVKRESVFELGSVTKQFTAFAVMLLVEQGKVSLSDPVRKYLPELPESWGRITVRHLLTHSSGIREYLSIEGLPDQAHSLEHRAMTKLFAERVPVDFVPGSTWAYSNTGYLLLGDLIERASGVSYWEFLQSQILVSAGMTSARSSAPRDIIPHRVAGYGVSKAGFENRNALSENAYAAGALVATIDDMVRWEALLQRKRLLAPASFEKMWEALTLGDGTLPPFSYGFGWLVDRENGHRAVFHSGGTPGFSSAIRRYPGRGLAVIVLANHSDRILDHIPMEIAGMVDRAVMRRERASDPEPATTRRYENIIGELLRGEVKNEHYTPPMQMFLRTATGLGLWQWIASHGELKTFRYNSSEPSDGAMTHRYRAQLGDAALWFSVTVAESGEVAQIYWW